MYGVVDAGDYRTLISGQDSSKTAIVKSAIRNPQSANPGFQWWTEVASDAEVDVDMKSGQSPGGLPKGFCGRAGT